VSHDALLSDLRPESAIDRLARALVAARSVRTERRSDYVSLRPGSDAAIAVYVHKNRVSVALDPLEAPSLTHGITGADLQRITPATTYAVIDAASVGRAHDAVLELAFKALGWRAQGPRFAVGERGRQGAELVRDTCPTCWETIALNGECRCS